MTQIIVLYFCAKCRQNLPIEQFPTNPQARATNACRTCWDKDKPKREREQRFRKQYGISTRNYERMLLLQGGGCAICRRKPNAKARTLAVDHCHKTGDVRGLLCYACNTALGAVGDNLAGVMRFVRYLRGLPAAIEFSDPSVKPRKSSVRPVKKTIVRYVGEDGRRTSKGSPGARKILERTDYYYFNFQGKMIPLRTSDLIEAGERMKSHIEKALNKTDATSN